jgi:hypothetical protein
MDPVRNSQKHVIIVVVFNMINFVRDGKNI